MLEFDLPTVAHQPASDEVIIVGIERTKLTKEEHLVGEAIHERRILDDAGSDDRCAARNNEDSTINGVRSCQLEVVSFEVDTTKEVEEGTEAEPSWLASHLLAGAHTTDLSILEGSHDCGKEVETGPEDMIIGKHSDLALHMRNCSTNLSTLAGEFCSEDCQLGGRIRQLEGFDNGLTGALVSSSDGNDDNCGRRVHQDGVEAFVEVFIERIDSRHNDRAVTSRVAWLYRNGCRLVDEKVSNDVDDQSQVSQAEEEPEEEVPTLSRRASEIENGQGGWGHESKC